MSAANLVAVSCDGPRLDLPCSAPRKIGEGNLYALRADLRRAGWTRRHHAGTQVDLCPICNSFAVLTPGKMSGGRPRKEVIQ